MHTIVFPKTGGVKFDKKLFELYEIGQSKYLLGLIFVRFKIKMWLISSLFFKVRKKPKLSMFRKQQI